MPNPMRLLLIGGSGMLGRAWQELLRRRSLPFTTLDRAILNLAEPGTLDRAHIEPQSIVVNCAAYTDVDGAEADPRTAEAVNGHGVGRLAQRCAMSNALLVHYSTDYVFNGQAHAPYRVNDPIQPINAYGRSKSLGEQFIRESGCPHLIVRTSWLYAPWGKNFVRTMTHLMADRDQLRVVDDQRGRPTSAEHLAQVTLALLDRGATGTFHITDGGECTWHAFACEIARLIGWKGTVLPCTSDQFPRPARRPAYSVLDLTETENLLGPMPHWKENLSNVVSRLE